MPFVRISWRAAFIVAMSLWSALYAFESSDADGLFLKASIFSATGRSFPATSLLTVDSASVVPCIASAWRGRSSFTLALRIAAIPGSGMLPSAVWYSANSLIWRARWLISVPRRSHRSCMSNTASSSLGSTPLNPGFAPFISASWRDIAPRLLPSWEKRSERSCWALIAASRALPVFVFGSMIPSWLNEAASWLPVNLSSALSVFAAAFAVFSSSFSEFLSSAPSSTSCLSVDFTVLPSRLFVEACAAFISSTSSLAAISPAAASSCCAPVAPASPCTCAGAAFCCFTASTPRRK